MSLRITSEKHPKATRRLPAFYKNGGHQILNYDGFNFSWDLVNLSDFCSAFPSEDPTEMAQSLISECQQLFLTSLLRTGISGDSATIRTLAQESANRIKKSISAQNHCFLVQVQILSETSEVNAVDGWSRHWPTREELSLMAHQSGMAAEEFLKRLVHCTFYRRALEGFSDPVSKESVSDEIERFVLALGLALSRPLKLDDIRIVSSPWERFPSPPFSYTRRYGSWDSHHIHASTVGFFSSPAFNPTRPRNVDYEIRCSKWLEILKVSPGSIFPLRAIQRGIWTILSAINDPDFLGDSNSLVGIHDVLVGMDGLIRKTEGGTTTQHRRKFEKAWRKIMEESHAFPGARSNKKVVERLYELRCILAHGGVDMLPVRLTQFKKAIGDRPSQGKYEPLFVGMNFVHWLGNLMETFLNKPVLLEELYTTPSRPKFRLGAGKMGAAAMKIKEKLCPWF